MAATDQSATEPHVFRDGLILFLVVFGIGGLILWELSDWPGLVASLRRGSDMAAFIRYARALRAGTWPGTEPFYRAPLFTFLVALILDLPLLACLVVQLLLFAASAVFIYLTGSLVAGRRGGFIAAGLLLGYGGSWLWITVLHSTVLELLLASFTLWCLVRWQQALRRKIQSDDLENGIFGNASLAWIALETGVGYGLLCLVRPNFLIIAPALAVGFLLQGRNVWRKVLAQGGLTVAACIVIFSPAVIHNNRHSDRLVFLTVNAGPTYRVANSEGSEAFNFVYSEGKLLKPWQIAFWKHQGIKAVGFWSSLEFPQNVNFYLTRDQSWSLRLLFLPFGLIGGLFLVGLFWHRKALTGQWPMLVMFFGYYFSVVLFFVIGRFRIPALPAMVVSAAMFIEALVRRLKESETRKPLLWLLPIAVIAVIAVLSWPFGRIERANDHFNLAVCAMFRQQPQQAVFHFSRLREMAGKDSESLQYAMACTSIGDHDMAFDLMMELSRKDPKNVDYAETVAGVCERRGERDRADRVRETLDRQFPGVARLDLILEGLKYYRQQSDNYSVTRPID